MKAKYSKVSSLKDAKEALKNSSLSYENLKAELIGSNTLRLSYIELDSLKSIKTERVINVTPSFFDSYREVRPLIFTLCREENKEAVKWLGENYSVREVTSKEIKAFNKNLKGGTKC